jgi:hypothetical protein
MGIAPDTRDGFQAGQYLRHPAGAEAEQPIIGLMLIEALGGRERGFLTPVST